MQTYLTFSGRVAGATLAGNALQLATVSGERQNADIDIGSPAPTVMLAQMQPCSAMAAHESRKLN